MTNLMSMSFDVVDEVLNGNLEKLAKIVEPLSENSKVAYIPSVEEQHERPEKDFALVLFHPHSGIIHKYALYTPELTELNLAYLKDKKDSLPDEMVKIAATNLVVAAKEHNLDIPEAFNDVADSDKYVPNLVDTREINSTEYAEKLSNPTTPGTYAWPDENKYPLDTEDNIKEAVAYFERYHKEFDDVNKKLEYAVNTKIASSKLDMELEGDQITKYANLSRSIFNSDFTHHINIRKSYLTGDQEEYINVYDDLLKRAEELGPVKTADVMYELDKKANITRAYGNGVEDPIISTLSNAEGTSDMIDGVLVKKSALDGVDDGVLTTLIGNDVISELKGEDGLAVLKSLPKPIRSEILEKL